MASPLVNFSNQLKLTRESAWRGTWQEKFSELGYNSTAVHLRVETLESEQSLGDVVRALSKGKRIALL